MLSYQLTTARSSFKEAIADQRYRCAGCGVPIAKGSKFFTKDYHRGRKVVGQTRLHNLEECWENYDEETVNALIQNREDREAKRRRA